MASIKHDDSQLCNCHYPIGLVIFLVFTILSLFVCICVCCFDITKCGIFKRKESQATLRKYSFDPRFMDTSKFINDRKLSLDPRLLEYSSLISNGSTSSQPSSRIMEVPNNLTYTTETSLVTTV